MFLFPIMISGANPHAPSLQHADPPQFSMKFGILGRFTLVSKYNIFLTLM